MAVLSLAPDLIDLWLVFYDEISDAGLLDQYRRLLTPDERLQEARFHFARDRRCYLVTRALVRTVLSRYSVVKPEDWRFERNAYGCPRIVAEQNEGNRMSFNLSHTAGLILLGVTCGHALGVDTENARARKAALDAANSFFSPREVRALRSLPARAQQERFFDYWTLKESYIKARGKGLSIPLDQFSFDFPDERGIEVSFCPELNDSPTDWRFWQVRVAEDYLAAICVGRSRTGRQRLVTRKVVPLDLERPFDCPVLRQSEQAVLSGTSL